MALNDGKAAIRISGFGGTYAGATIGTTGIGLVYSSTPTVSAQHVSLTNDTTVAISFNDGIAAVGVPSFCRCHASVAIGAAGIGLVYSSTPTVSAQHMSLTNDTTVSISFNDGVTAVGVFVFAGSYASVAIGAAGIGQASSCTPASSAKNVPLAKDTAVAIALDDGVTAVGVFVFAGSYPGVTISAAGPGLVSIGICRTG